jgi:hypothetical protein
LANRFGHLIANAARIGQPHGSLFRWRRPVALSTVFNVAR